MAGYRMVARLGAAMALLAAMAGGALAADGPGSKLAALFGGPGP